jgi:hypothetical protein
MLIVLVAPLILLASPSKDLTAIGNSGLPTIVAMDPLM